MHPGHGRSRRVPADVRWTTVRDPRGEEGELSQLTTKNCSPTSTRVPRAMKYRLPAIAAARLGVGLPDDRAVRRVAVADPEAAGLLTELEMRLRHRLAGVEDRHQLIDVFARLHRRVAPDQARAGDRHALAGAELQHVAGSGCRHRRPGGSPRGPRAAAAPFPTGTDPGSAASAGIPSRAGLISARKRTGAGRRTRGRGRSARHRGGGDCAGVVDSSSIGTSSDSGRARLRLRLRLGSSVGRRRHRRRDRDIRRRLASRSTSLRSPRPRRPRSSSASRSSNATGSASVRPAPGVGSGRSPAPPGRRGNSPRVISVECRDGRKSGPSRHARNRTRRRTRRPRPSARRTAGMARPLGRAAAPSSGLPSGRSGRRRRAARSPRRAEARSAIEISSRRSIGGIRRARPADDSAIEPLPVATPRARRCRSPTDVRSRNRLPALAAEQGAVGQLRAAVSTGHAAPPLRPVRRSRPRTL